MDDKFPDPGQMNRIRTLSELLLEDPVFRRSPVLARLLRYLVEKTAAGEPIKSYSIAFDGLGRPNHDLADADTYARVAVARLRKTLAAYYATHQAAEQIQIDSGTYHVRLATDPLAQTASESRASAPAAIANEPEVIGPLHGLLRGRQIAWVLSISLFALFAIAILGWQKLSKHEDATKWEASFPILVVVSDDTGKGIPPGESEAQKQEFIASLDQYNGFLVADRPPDTADFVVRISNSSLRRAPSQTVTLTERTTGIVVWAETFPVPETGGLGQITESAVAAIAPPNGALLGYLRAKGYDVNTPIGCWLRYTEGVQAFNTARDEDLRHCAMTWYDTTPNRRHAAFLYAWTLIDSASISRDPSERASALKQAFAIIRTAITLHPDFPLFYIAAMRGYALEGDRPMVIQSARDAMRAGGHNRLVVGMAASTLAYWNDPVGEQTLLVLASYDEQAYPWEHVGLFVSAMMRDDTTAAGRQIADIEKFENGQPLLLIVKAAYAARMGHPNQANDALVRLRANPVVRVLGVRSVVDRLPIAPEVAQRLRQWLPSDI